MRSAWSPAIPLTIRSYGQAEDLAAKYMRWVGYHDARRTPPGPDAGLDVISSRALAQVKFKTNSTGRPDLQRLYGARAHAQDKALAFFSRSSFTATAHEYAGSTGIALFRFDDDGRVWPVNQHAVRVHGGAVRRDEEREQARIQKAARVAAAASARRAKKEAAASARRLAKEARRRAKADRATVDRERRKQRAQIAAQALAERQQLRVQEAARRAMAAEAQSVRVDHRPWTDTAIAGQWQPGAQGQTAGQVPAVLDAPQRAVMANPRTYGEPGLVHRSDPVWPVQGSMQRPPVFRRTRSAVTVWSVLCLTVASVLCSVSLLCWFALDVIVLAALLGIGETTDVGVFAFYLVGAIVFGVPGSLLLTTSIRRARRQARKPPR